MRDTSRSEIISTQLRQIAEQAVAHPDQVFTTLIHRMDVDFLREAYYRLRKDGAPGLSGKTAKDYLIIYESKPPSAQRNLQKDKVFVVV